VYRNDIENQHDEVFYVLAVDDSATMRAAFELNISKITNTIVKTCEDAAQAVTICQEFDFDLVIVDYEMPKMKGIELIRHLRQMDNFRTVPMIMVTADLHREVKLGALSAGVNDFLNKPFDPVELKARVSNMLDLRLAQKRLARNISNLSANVDNAMREIIKREKEMIWRLALAVEAREGGTGAHVARVARISRCLARGLRLEEAHCQLIYLAAALHDIGKIGTPDAILGKAGKLTPEETIEMRRHVEYGAKILRDGATELVRVAEAVVRGHHEKWDGSGYPAGLSGDAISIEARIVAVADVFEALCSERSYKPAWPFEKAFAEIIAGSGSHFDPACVAVFKCNEIEIRNLMAQSADNRIPDEPTDLPAA
jgi:putative two-component system response regulator